jgi:hypothetical protein
MFTLCGFYEAQDGAAALHNLTAVPDPHITVSGDDIRVPRGMAYLVGEIALSDADVALTDARIVAPSLRRICNIQIEPIINALVFGSPPEQLLHPESPTPLKEDESLQFQINSDDSGTAKEYGLLWFSDGVQSSVSGRMYSIRATASATLVAGQWVNSALVFAQALAVGEYEIVGLRARGTNLVAARFEFVGGAWRPGVAAVNAIGDEDHRLNRFGRLGSFGRFHTTTPPTMEFLGETDTSQEIVMDLIKISGM